MALDWDEGKVDAVGEIMSTAPASVDTDMAETATMSVSVAIPSGGAAGRAQTILVKKAKAIITPAVVMDMANGMGTIMTLPVVAAGRAMMMRTDMRPDMNITAVAKTATGRVKGAVAASLLVE